MNNWTGVPRYEKIGDYVIYYRDEEEQTVITQIERGDRGDRTVYNPYIAIPHDHHMETVIKDDSVLEIWDVPYPNKTTSEQVMNRLVGREGILVFNGFPLINSGVRFV